MFFLISKILLTAEYLFIALVIKFHQERNLFNIKAKNISSPVCLNNLRSLTTWLPKDRFVLVGLLYFRTFALYFCSQEDCIDNSTKEPPAEPLMDRYPREKNTSNGETEDSLHSDKLFTNGISNAWQMYVINRKIVLSLFNVSFLKVGLSSNYIGCEW